MRTYELTFIVDAQPSPEKQEEVIANFLELLKSHNVEMISVEKWGKRKLAYMIDDHQYGHYVLTQFKAKSDLLPQIEHHLKLSPSIIRYLLLHRDSKTLKLMQMETERVAHEAMVSAEASRPPAREAAKDEKIDESGKKDSAADEISEKENQGTGEIEPDEKE